MMTPGSQGPVAGGREPRNHHDAKRARLIKLVHIAKHELQLAEENYRAALSRWNKQGSRQPVASSTEMTVFQLGELLVFLQGLGFKVRRKAQSAECSAPRPSRHAPGPMPYASSIAGLREEITDLAKVRWTGDWEQSLNNLCKRFGVQHWQWLDVGHGKAVKETILRLNREGAKAAKESNG